MDAEITGTRAVTVKTHNVTALTLTMPPGYCPLENSPELTIDGAKFAPTAGAAGRLGPLVDGPPAQRRERQVEVAVQGNDDALRKRHGLQGPIDDAFMDSFLMVRPTGKPLNDKVGAWAGKEMAHAVDALAQAVPRRGACQGRRRRDRGGHRRAQPGAVGRPAEQQGAGEDRRQAADPLGRRQGRGARAEDLHRRRITCRC